MNSIIAFLLKQFEGKTLKFSLDSDDDNVRAIEGKLEVKNLVANVRLDLKEVYDELSKRV